MLFDTSTMKTIIFNVENAFTEMQKQNKELSTENDKLKERVKYLEDIIFEWEEYYKGESTRPRY